MTAGGLVKEHRVTRDAVEHIVGNLRQRDREEIFALRWNDDEDELVTEIMLVCGDLFRVWSYEGEPVAINGATPVRPGVAHAAAFGTDKWRYTIRAMTVWSQTWLIPALQSAGYHRGEAYVSAANIQSRRWLDVLGAQREAYLHQYGRNREDYVLYTWRLNDVLRGRRWRWQQRATDAVVSGRADRTDVCG